MTVKRHMRLPCPRRGGSLSSICGRACPEQALGKRQREGTSMRPNPLLAARLSRSRICDLGILSTPSAACRILAPSCCAGNGWPPTISGSAGAGWAALRSCGLVMSPTTGPCRLAALPLTRRARGGETSLPRAAPVKLPQTPQGDEPGRPKRRREAGSPPDPRDIRGKTTGRAAARSHCLLNERPRGRPSSHLPRKVRSF